MAVKFKARLWGAGNVYVLTVPADVVRRQKFRKHEQFDVQLVRIKREKRV